MPDENAGKILAFHREFQDQEPKEQPEVTLKIGDAQSIPKGHFKGHSRPIQRPKATTPDVEDDVEVHDELLNGVSGCCY